MIDRLSNVQKLNICKNVTMMKQIWKFSITDYLKSIGMELKTAMILVGFINSFWIYLTQFLIYIPKGFWKIKSKACSESLHNKGIAKSSKRKQKLNKKFVKHRTRETELACKSSKNLFESLNKKSKKNITQKKCLSASMMLKNVQHYEGTNRNNKLKS